jgi:hypothetical protein
MSMQSQSSDNKLDKPDDLVFQRRWWVVERTGWFLMVLAVVAGASGFLGRGPASEAHVASSDGQVVLEYERMARLQAPTRLRLRLPESSQSREMSVALPHQYARHVRVEQIMPAPRSTSATDEDLVFQFQLQPADAEVWIDFELKIETIGSLEGSVRVDHRRPLRFSQFVYP